VKTIARHRENLLFATDKRSISATLLSFSLLSFFVEARPIIIKAVEIRTVFMTYEQGDTKITIEGPVDYDQFLKAIEEIRRQHGSPEPGKQTIAPAN
jgi:hypothetical protein